MAKQTKNTAAPKAKVIKTITVRDCFGPIKPHSIEDETPLLRVMGGAFSVKSGVSQYGPWHKLVGEFEATNLQTGESFTATLAILPNEIQDVIVGAITSGQTKIATIAVDICVVPTTKGSMGYTYIGKPLLEQKSGLLAAVKAEVEQKLLAAE